jgi:hypothetical protein
LDLFADLVEPLRPLLKLEPVKMSEGEFFRHGAASFVEGEDRVEVAVEGL